MPSTDAPIYDAAVYGSGYAGFAAATALADAGWKVLLVDRRATLLWEGAWAFHTAVGDSRDPAWTQFLAEVAARGAAPGGIPDGAASEAIAAGILRRRGISLAWYRAPLAVERDAAGRLAGLVVGGKSGISRLRARRWIDASDGGELLGLMDARARGSTAARQASVLHLRRAGAFTDADFAWDLADGGRATWTAGIWVNERRLVLDLPADRPHRRAWVPALHDLRRRSAACAEAVVSHASVVPFPSGRGALADLDLPANVGNAIPTGVEAETLSGRFARGLAAARALLAAPAADAIEQPLPTAAALTAATVRCAVAVAGAGTGGAVAAWSAARSGADTWAIEPLPFLGGIGSGGGIHAYYFGVKGGLQEALDQRCRDLMPAFGAARQIRGFHPDAKKVALEELCAEAGVTIAAEATLVAVEREGNRVRGALLATPAGPLRLDAAVWIDGTGDGDLCAAAGATSTFGRQGDGLPHAWTQSSGRCRDHEGLSQMQMINFDGGWVDPRDDDDLTRARCEGLIQHLQPVFTAENRTTAIAPAFGLRQGRQIVTDRVLTLDDLIVRRRDADAVGLTGCHYDNHAVDYAFESDEGMFWVWGCRGWRFGRTGGAIPYGSLVPRGLDNVLIASRALGVTQDAHHSLRMQRDMQRIGEVAGLAAALARACDGDVRAIDRAALRAGLEATGALAAAGDEDDGGFGKATSRGDAVTLRDASDADCLRDLRGDEPWYAMWQLARPERDVGDAVAEVLADADPRLTWRAAVVLAQRGDARAEPRLIGAIHGDEDGTPNVPGDLKGDHWNRRVPNAWLAVALLRRCGTAACLPALAMVAVRPVLPFHLATILALTVERLVQRLPAARADLTALVRRLEVQAVDSPMGEPQEGPFSRRPSHRLPGQDATVVEDRRWQLDLVHARTARALGVATSPAAARHLQDPRALVRVAFAAVGTGAATRAAAG